MEQLEQVSSISYSQYKLWKTCPLAWKNRYIDKLDEFDASIHSIFGTAMHETIQEWLSDAVYAGKSDHYIKHVDLSDKLRRSLIEEAKPHMLQEDGSYLFSREELEEFYNQGLEILKYIQTHYKKIFPTQDTILFDIEYELLTPIRNGIYFKGYIDIVTKTGDKYNLYDLKTSTNGWGKWKKNDKSTTDQLVLYKNFFAQQEGIDPDNIEVEFVILKRKLFENSSYPIPRISSFIPSHKGPSIKKALVNLDSFINECFTDDGFPHADNVIATPSKSNCKYCSWRNDCEFSC